MSRLFRTICVLLLTVVTVCATSESAFARSYYVRKRGSDRNSGTSANQAFQTLTRAFLQPLGHGDTVYIGSGIYTTGGTILPFATGLGLGTGVGVKEPGRFSSSLNQSLRVVADTTGQFTGDRGEVVVAALNGWAFTVLDNVSVQFEGLTFGLPHAGNLNFGVYANGAGASVAALNCTFQNVSYGSLVRSGRFTASNCKFTGNIYGVYASSVERCVLHNCGFSNSTLISAIVHSRDAVIDKCLFDQSKYGLYIQGVDSNSKIALKDSRITNCTFGLYGTNCNVVLDGAAAEFQNCAYDIYLNNCVSDISGLAIANGQRPLTLVSGTAAIRDLRIGESKSYGIYAVNMDRISLSGSRFGNTPSWAAYLHGREVSASDCRFDQSKNGLLLSGVDAKSTIDVNGLDFNGCVQGLYCRNSLILPSRDNAITTSNCTYGVVLNNCRSELSGIESRDDTRSVSIYGGEARISRVDVKNSKSYGIYTANMKQLEVKGCRFDQTASWAVHAYGQNLSVTDSSFNGTRYGLYVREFSQTDAPVLRDLSFSGCSYGLRCDSSPVVVSRDNHLTFSDCAYAVTLNSCISKLQGLDLSGSQRPLNLYRGTAAIDGLVIRTSKSLGVYSSTMDQLSVINSQFGETGSWALYAHGQNLLVEKSQFSGSRYGLYLQETSGTKSPVLSDLTISNCSGTGLQVASSAVTLSKASNIRVDNCGYGIYLANCTSQLSGLSLSSSNIPLYVNGGTCKADGVTIEKAGTYGLLAYRMLEFSGKNLKCSGARSWGFYGYGQKFSISDSTVASCGHGVYIDGQGDKRPIPLSNVAVQDNSGYGLYVKNASFAVAPKSTLKILRNGGTGLYLTGQNIDLNADSGIEVADNGIGVYANGTDVKMSGFDLSGNGYGILQYYGNLECRDSVISGGRYGVYQVHSPVCLLEDTTISGTSSWGVIVNNSQAKNQKVTLKDSKVLKCGGGINATMLNDASLNVSGSTITDNRSHGIYSWRANSTLTKSTVARNQGYGVLHYDGLIDVSDSTIDGSGSYGLMAYGYQNSGAARLVAHRNRVTDNLAGIFAYRVDNAEIVNNVAARNRSYGVAVSVAGNGAGEVWNNSIVDNRYGVWHLGGKGSIRNNLIANGDMKAKDASAFGIYRSNGTVEIGHNLLFGQQRKYVNTKPGVGDVLKPPRFVDHAKGDYRLAAGSPAINAGTSPGKLTAVDIQGLSRPMFDAYEIGAFEYPVKSGSLRILDWGELATRPTKLPVTLPTKAPSTPVILNGQTSINSLESLLP